MGKERRTFDKEFKTTIVALINNGKTVSEVCSEYDLNDSVVRRWRRESITETGSFKDEATLALEKENRTLKKQLKDAQEERDILKKAVRIFSVSDK